MKEYIEYDKLQLYLTKANIELIQKVDKLIKLLEKDTNETVNFNKTFKEYGKINQSKINFNV